MIGRSDERTIVESIPVALEGERIDRVVALMADVSRREATQLIHAGAVTVDGRPPDKPSIRVEPSMMVQVVVPARTDDLAADPSVPVVVIHEDDHVLVIDKAAGQVVHPGSGVRDTTLVNGLLARYPELADVGEADRPGIVHRLDRGTSGLLMVARTAVAYRSLVAQLAERTVHRRYLTLVAGLFESSGGLIDAPLGRSRHDATRRAVVADGRPARTRYEVLDRFPETACSYLECRLETGRTHQIRAHLAAIDHPVAGDDRYGGGDLGERLGLARPFLHATHLGFDHPDTGRSMRFDTPLPADLADVLAMLRP